MIAQDILDYIDAAVRTEKVPYFEVPADIHVPGQVMITRPRMHGVIGDTRVRILHSGLGMMTEIAELQEALEKRDWVNVGEEVGDVLWYWAVAMHACKFDRMQFRALPTSYMLAEARTGRPLIAAICAWGDLVRKDAIHSKGMKPEDALAALFDVFDEACTLCEAVNISPMLVMRRNIAKLRVRFPDKYDGVRFDQRDLESERAVLERDPVQEALRILLEFSEETLAQTKMSKDGVLCWTVTLPDTNEVVYVAESDLILARTRKG